MKVSAAPLFSVNFLFVVELFAHATGEASYFDIGEWTTTSQRNAQNLRVGNLKTPSTLNSSYPNPSSSSSSSRASGPVAFQACQFSMTVQESVTVVNHTLTQQREVCEKNSTSLMAPLSEVSACVASLKLDSDHALQYLESVYNMTRDFYVYTDTAVNAPLSVPSVTPFDFPIYNGTNAGQVDVLEKMKVLMEDVKTNGATCDLIYSVNEIYNHLRDSHVLINRKVLHGEVLGLWHGLMAEEVLTGISNQTRVHVVSETPASFDLTIDFLHANGTSDSKLVQSIDGKHPLTFLNEMAKLPIGITSQKSLGPRVHRLMHRMFYNYADNATDWVAWLLMYQSPDSSKYWKDKYDIVYADGTTSSWTMFRTIPCSVQANMSVADIEVLHDKPGSVYEIIQQAIGEANSTGSATLPFSYTEELEMSDDLNEAVSSSEEPVLNFTVTLNSNQTNRDLLGYQVFDDYAVLKLRTFSTRDQEAFYEAWGNVTQIAHERNITKLIIDVIDNGGGIVVMGYLLTALLYPDVSWFDIGNPYDVLNNPIRNYTRSVKPKFDDLRKQALNPETITNATAALNQNNATLIAKLEKAVDIFEGMWTLIENATIKERDKMTVFHALEVARLVNSTVSARSPVQIQFAETLILWQGVLRISKADSLNVGLPANGEADNFFTVDGKDPSQYIRGGINGSYTAPFSLVDPRFLTRIQDRISDMPRPFDEYLILSNGVAGSTTSQFHFTSYFYSKANSGKVPPIRAVTYGGNGVKEDCPPTQFIGGAVSTVRLEPIYIPEGYTNVLTTLFGETNPTIREIADGYKVLTVQPCYYCSGLPSFTTIEIYSILQGAKSIPLEFVNVPTDHYIPRWFFNTSFENDSDLPELYEETRKFFQTSPTSSHDSNKPHCWHRRCRKWPPR